MEEFIGTKLMEGITWNELGMNKCIYYVVLSVGHTLLYHHISKCQEGWVDDSITNGSQGSLTFIRTRTFFLYRLKKSTKTTT